MRLLQRYILFELLRVFGSLIIVLTVLLVFVGVFNKVSESGLGPHEVVQILPFVVPSLLPFTIPATLLLAVCVVYGRIAGDQEVTAAKAAGINVLSLLWPSFLLGVVLSVCSLVTTDQMIPWAVDNIQRKGTEAMENIFLDQLRSKRSAANKDQGWSLSVIDVIGKKLIYPLFEYTPPGRSTITVQADEATIEFDIEKQRVVLHLVRGEIDTSDRANISFDEEVYPFPLPFENSKPKPRHLSIRNINHRLKEVTDKLDEAQRERDIETACALLIGDFDRLDEADLTRYETQFDRSRKDLAKLRTAIHLRFSLASSCFFFALLGGPFAIVLAHRQFLTSFFLCFGPILVGYYPIVLLMMNISKSGTVNPAWAMWVGNGLVLVASAVVLHKVLRH